MSSQDQNKPSKLSPKITFGFLGLMGFASLVLGVVNISKTINNPGRVASQVRNEIVNSVQTGHLLQEEYLKNQDTDQDGLTDYLELNTYGTSPYLADSDSDGYSDKQEIDSGNDPNCPTGSNCRSAQTDISGEQTDDFGLDQFGDLLDFTEIVAEPETTLDETDLADFSVAEIRELLLASGEMSQEQLDQIDDETLLEVYREVLGESQTN